MSSDIYTLIKRIRNGAEWLSQNSQTACLDNKRSYLPQKYEKHLLLYEHLVNELIQKGFSEADALQQEWTEEQIERVVAQIKSELF